MKFKVQLPLSSSEESPQALVYNEDRSVMGRIEVTEEVLSLFKPGQVKVYVHGNMRRDGKLMVDTVIAGGEDW